MSDASDITAALAPLARSGAPLGFAARLERRYRQQLDARRRRTAVALSTGCFASLAAVVVPFGVSANVNWSHPSGILASVVTGITTTSTVLMRAMLHPVVDNLARTASTLVAMSVLAAACAIAMAVLVRRETSLSGRTQ